MIVDSKMPPRLFAHKNTHLIQGYKSCPIAAIHAEYRPLTLQNVEYRSQNYLFHQSDRPPTPHAQHDAISDVVHPMSFLRPTLARQ